MRTLILVAACAATCALPPLTARIAGANGIDAQPVVVSTLGGSTNAGDRDGPAQSSQFDTPMGVAVAPDGTVYASDSEAGTIRSISPAGDVRTVGGRSGQLGYKDGPAAEAQFKWPHGIAVGPDGTVYVADTGNQAIRTLSHGVVSTLTGHRSGRADGSAETAEFIRPIAVAVDAATGNLYVADALVGVRKVTPNGSVTTFSPLPSTQHPTGVACAGRSLYVAGPNGLSLYDMPSGSFARAIGPEQYLMGGGHLGYPYAIAAVSDFQIAFTDVREQTVRYADSFEFSRVIAGAADWDPTMFAGGFADGDARVARFNAPTALAFRRDGSLVVADAGNHRIRSISAWDRRSYVTATGVNLERYQPGPDEDGIAWIGPSLAWSDTTWYQSIQGTLQRELEASPYYHGKKRQPRVIPLAFPGSEATAYVSAIRAYFGGGSVKVVILQLGGSGFAASTTPAQIAASLRQIAALLKAGNTSFIVICHPVGYADFPSESLAQLTEIGGKGPSDPAGASSSYRVLLAAVKASGVPMYDAYPDFARAERGTEGPLFGTNDPHLNDRGRALLAKSAYNALVEYYYAKR